MLCIKGYYFVAVFLGSVSLVSILTVDRARHSEGSRLNAVDVFN